MPSCFPFLSIFKIHTAIYSGESNANSPAIPGDKAIRIMHEERGKSFDPDLFDLFMDEEDKLYLRYINTQLFKEVS